ncbi:predicted protein [Histoplasma capsulatum G186AR]|uniref:Uncharacterized protein n=1 Tax=Ajellomyces capsulatus (strain G186AR / H82 / ATCC MYA-2454 / RMSCC 2432) TaxID=447093 RepID=C0NDF4_AJECG|nr:uncharacterized protein HCBG_01150 [Histoplasma capsulatum G186AR]EEH11695.1 predicted protein [Histoplasma capsulatum G186AR]
MAELPRRRRKAVDGLDKIPSTEQEWLEMVTTYSLVNAKLQDLCSYGRPFKYFNRIERGLKWRTTVRKMFSLGNVFFTEVRPCPGVATQPTTYTLRPPAAA